MLENEKVTIAIKDYPEYIAVSKIGDYINFLSSGTIRQMIYWNKDGFKDKCLYRINGRQYIKTSAFFDFIEQTNKVSA